MADLTNILPDLTNFHFLCLVLISLLLIVLIGFVCYSSCKQKNLTFYSDANQNSKNSTELELEESKDSTQKEGSSEDYTESSEDEYPSEEGYFMDHFYYPFRDFDLNVRARAINGFDIRGPFWTWSLGKVHFIDLDTKGTILWVWVQILFYYPTPMPTPLILRCRLSEDLGAHPIWTGDFVLLEYDMNEEYFLNRTFNIIKIFNN
jgi:hypothetical protein